MCVKVARLYSRTFAPTFIKLISLQSLGSATEIFFIQSGTGIHRWGKKEEKEPYGNGVESCNSTIQHHGKSTYKIFSNLVVYHNNN